MGEKNLEINTDIEEGVMVDMDAELLSLVWNNLFSNAIKFTEAGGMVTLSLKSEGEDAVVQVAFNIPAAGPNGLGGVTVDGKVSSYEVKTDKKGTIYLSMNVMGTGISARLDISMPKGTNNATVTILPNFNSNRLTLNGVILPACKSSIFKGRSL